MIKSISINSNILDLSEYIKNYQENPYCKSYLTILNDGERGTWPNSILWSGVACGDSINGDNDHAFSKFEVAVDNTEVRAQITAYHNTVGTQEYAALGVVTTQDNSKYAFTSTPNNSSNTIHIATTEWVRNLLRRNGINLTS